jgi:hypothetical protein
LLTKAKKSWENSYFSYNIFFGRFSAAFAQNRRPYCRQIFPANHYFIRPVNRRLILACPEGEGAVG